MLPKSIDPIRLCKQGVSLQGTLVLSTLPRLQELCDQGKHEVDVLLTLGMDHNGTRFIQGSIKGVARLFCQRCNSEMEEPLDVTFSLSPVTSHERAKQLPESYEALMVTEENVVVAEMIEDEILLALPMVSRHEEGTCCGLATS